MWWSISYVAVSLARKELRPVTDVTQAAILWLQIQNDEQLKKATNYTAFPLTYEIPLRFKLIQHSAGCANKCCIIELYVYKINCYRPIVTSAEVNGTFEYRR